MLNPELRNLLQPLGDNAVTLDMLVEQVKSPLGVVPFVGAGMSVPFQFPQWAEFLENLALDNEQKQAIRDRLKDGEYEEAAQDLVDWRGGNAFQDAVDHAFGPAKLEGKELKGAVCLLPRLASGPILTTNFDQVLERVFAAAQKPFRQPVILGMKTDLIRDAFNRNLRYLIKLHGDAADRNDRVLTLKEYEKHYGTDEPLLPVLKFAMQRPLLFLGCSLRLDRTVRVLESLRDEMGGMGFVHYAIMEAPKEGKVLHERQRYLSERGIRVVWIPTGRFDLIGDLLEYLGSFREPPPSDEKIVPRGLRSFEAEDHAWFLRLVPGPRDSHGLPASLSRWKERVEQLDPDHTFKVALIYGPIGCGKSSLLKAGLIPELSSESILPLCVTATGDQTEKLMLTELRKALAKLTVATGEQTLPNPPADQSLSQTLAWLLANPEASGRRKVVFFLDQFEQWLHTHQKDVNGELADTLRTCDGGRLQCVLMARDDFQMAAHRLFQALEVPLHEGDNYWLVDLFDLEHAHSVLVEYGRAYGRLPDPPEQLSEVQMAFVKEVIEKIKTPEDRVVCIRLVLLAEMLKDQEWTLATLEKSGYKQDIGTAVGKAFLEKELGPRCAKPSHRAHRNAAEKALESLLPAAGVAIKKGSCSATELQRASGYSGRPKDFQELLSILDDELKIITPTEHSSGGPTESPAHEASSLEKYYQLTHDYLVPSLRDWLTEALRKTVRGRAILGLRERAAQWAMTRSWRFLPAPEEYLRILWLAPRANRSPDQLAMMRSAAFYYTGLLAALVCLASVSYKMQIVVLTGRTRTLVQAIETAAPQYLPHAIANLRPLKDRALKDLRVTFLNERNLDSRRKLHAAMALAAFGDDSLPKRLPFLLDCIADPPPGQCPNLVLALAATREPALQEIAKEIDKAKTPEVRVRFATVALFLGDQAPLRRLTMLTNNPDNRTAFIHGYPNWPGDPLELAGILTNNVTTRTNGDLLSALCAAVGRTDRKSYTDTEREQLRKAIERLYTEALDGGTHSAAAYALNRWGITNLPSLGAMGTIRGQADWFVNSEGMTMVRVPEGTFNMGDPEGGMDAKPHPVTLRTFFMADREVTVAQFARFVEAVQKSGTNAPPAERIDDWRGYDTKVSPTTDCAVQQVSWSEAVKFCNWLSRRDGRKPCYEAFTENTNEVKWTCNFQMNGYRLPTEAEWERACRGLSEGPYAFGDQGLLAEYGYSSQNSLGHTWPAGRKLPNAWGLFDMYGNVWEWCHDSFAAYTSEPTNNPTGPLKQKAERVLRGGDFSQPPDVCRSGFRYSRETWDSSIGFRVALVPGIQPGSAPHRP